MKLLYATSIFLPSTRANRIQIVSMARAFHALLGTNFVLGLAVDATDALTDMPTVAVGDRTRSFVLAGTYLTYAAQNGMTHIFCREEKLLLFLILYAWLRRSPVQFVYEIHHLKYLSTLWGRWLLRHTPYVVSITDGMSEILKSTHHYTGALLVAPDAADVELFDVKETKEKLREELRLPNNRKIVLYAGSLDPWKGVGSLYDASKLFGPEVLFVIVGGKPHYIDEFRETYPERPDFLMVGQKDYETELPKYLRAADVLILPNTATEEISRVATSPLKLFAYMASGTPLVATDIPSLREVLNPDLAILVAADNPAALADGIRVALSDTLGSEERAARAQALVRERYTWRVRAQTIISFLTHA